MLLRLNFVNQPPSPNFLAPPAIFSLSFSGYLPFPQLFLYLFPSIPSPVFPPRPVPPLPPPDHPSHGTVGPSQTKHPPPPRNCFLGTFSPTKCHQDRLFFPPHGVPRPVKRSLLLSLFERTSVTVCPPPLRPQPFFF